MFLVYPGSDRPSLYVIRRGAGSICAASPAHEHIGQPAMMPVGTQQQANDPGQGGLRCEDHVVSGVGVSASGSAADRMRRLWWQRHELQHERPHAHRDDRCACPGVEHQLRPGRAAVMELQRCNLVYGIDIQFHGWCLHRRTAHQWYGHRGTDGIRQRHLHAELRRRQRHGVGDYRHGDRKSFDSQYALAIRNYDHRTYARSCRTGRQSLWTDDCAKRHPD